jgi:hypothetical protein
MQRVSQVLDGQDDGGRALPAESANFKLPDYQPTVTDQRGLPPLFHSEERYVGYRDADEKRPYAHFFKPEPLPIQAHARAALKAGPVGPERVIPLARLAHAMSRPGYLALETGFGIGADGMACVACLTDMPGVEPAMWQWWFGWHLKESARYKLWHPAAHVFTMPGEQRSDDPLLSLTQKYVGNVSYIDEYIGGRMMRLAVRFVPPSTLGFDEGEQDAKLDSVTIIGRGGPSLAPVTAVWLIHQVRRTPEGSEMRSRFYIGPPVPLIGVPAASALPGDPPPEPGPLDLLEHCATEMNHLASFLPELYREFGAAVLK